MFAVPCAHRPIDFPARPYPTGTEDEFGSDLPSTGTNTGTSRLANPSRTLHQIPTIGVLDQVSLNRIEDIQSRRSRQSVQSRGKSLRFDVYHSVVYTTQ
jgi:hypothetical protein